MRVGEHVRQRPPRTRRRSREPSMSTGFATLASAGRSSVESGDACLVGERRKLETGSLAGVGAEDAQTAGIRQRRHGAPARQRPAESSDGDVDQLLERLRADDAGLAEQRARSRIGACERGRVRARCALAALRAPALQREDRLAPRDAGARCARTCAGCRTTRRRAGRARSRRRPPTTRAGRSWRRPPCSRSRRTRRGRGRARPRPRAARARARRSGTRSRSCPAGARAPRRSR